MSLWKSVEQAFPEHDCAFKPRRVPLRNRAPAGLALCIWTLGLLIIDNCVRPQQSLSDSVLASVQNVLRSSWRDANAECKSPACLHSAVRADADVDNDGISDALEQELAEKFAPVI